MGSTARAAISVPSPVWCVAVAQQGTALPLLEVHYGGLACPATMLSTS